MTSVDKIDPPSARCESKNGTNYDKTSGAKCPPLPSSGLGKGTFKHGAEIAIRRATEYARQKVRDDSHWLGPLSAEPSITAEWIFLNQAFGRSIPPPDADAYRFHFLSTQQADGSWAIAPSYPGGGNLSVTIEVYLALKILGLDAGADAMQRARQFVLASGGVEKMRIFTRFHLAIFGLLPWASVPQMPPEIVWLPPWFPVNLYRFSYWARMTMVPFLVIRTHEPVLPLPNSPGVTNAPTPAVSVPVPRPSPMAGGKLNDYLDELWLDPARKQLPYTKPMLPMLLGDPLALLFQLADTIIWLVVMLASGLLAPIRRRALSACTDWLLARQEDSGDWAGIFPPMHLSVYVLHLQGLAQDSDPIVRVWQALDRFTYTEPKRGKWMQPCVSPVWDTFLMIRGLADCSTVDQLKDPMVTRAVAWARSQQILVDHGDWRVYRPNLAPGGFAFEYFNSWYPDVDDTAAGILAFLTQDEDSVAESHVVRAAAWVLGMQNRDGGWAAFEADNDALFLNSIPVSDMDALCDPSSPDVAGRVLEAFGLMLRINRENLARARKEKKKDRKLPALLEPAFVDALTTSCRRAIAYLERCQEPFGAWYGRWGCNFILGTSNCLAGLWYFAAPDSVDPAVASRAQKLVAPAVCWLESVQNHDGGWGEGLDSYTDAPAKAGVGESTPSQTAWALMGLLAFVDPRTRVVGRGIAWLLATQTDTLDEGPRTEGEGEGTALTAKAAASWPQEAYTGTGFPGHLYLGYDLYRHYFPMMALGRYIKALEAK